jgi:hypothetical protein
MKLSVQYSICGRGSQTSALASEPRAHEGARRPVTYPSLSGQICGRSQSPPSQPSIPVPDNPRGQTLLAESGHNTVVGMSQNKAHRRALLHSVKSASQHEHNLAAKKHTGQHSTAAMWCMTWCCGCYCRRSAMNLVVATIMLHHVCHMPLVNLPRS